MEAVELIHGDQVNSTHDFILPIDYVSCQVTDEFIAFLDAAGKWKPSNISATVLQLINGDRLKNKLPVIKVYVLLYM